MNTNKSNLKETLVNSYKEKIDYKIIKEVSNGLKGKLKETILLTPKCFKLMAITLFLVKLKKQYKFVNIIMN